MKTKELFTLAENQEFDKIKAFSEAGGGINVVNDNNENLIHIIARYDNANELMAYLIKKGVDINQQEKLMLDSPLMIATKYDCLKNVKLLLENNANPYLINSENYAAFSLATFNEFNEIINVFIAYKVDINFHGETFNTPLISAIEGEVEEELLDTLLENGADINCGNGNKTALFAAISYENEELVQFLIEKGAKIKNVVNKANETIFEFANRVGNTEIIEYLEQYK